MRAQVISRDGYSNRLLIDPYDGNFYTEEDFEVQRPNGAAAKAIIEYFLLRRRRRIESLEGFME